MKCPFCGAQDTKVIDSRPADDNSSIRRRRQCEEFEGLKPCLEGPTGLAICKTDATAAARILANFAKTAPALELKGGVVEGTFYDAAGIAVIANITSSFARNHNFSADTLVFFY